VENSNISIAWELLFDSKYDDILNPNLPQNTARMNAEQKKKANDFKKFVEGEGRVLFDQWKKDIREKVLQLLSNPKVDECNCHICSSVRELRYILHLCISAERIITEQKEKKS